ncbi:MAG: two-component sensor histidine kinase [Negativicutes bacterium]|nr:two-component sensor histidine kinase [Negativicutes bacterium]
MKYTLRFKLTTAFLLITLLFSLLIGLFANITLQRQFKNYVMNNLNDSNEQIITTLETRYRDWGNQWNLTGLEILGVSALNNGLLLQIRDRDGTVLWDAMTQNRDFCAEIMQGMAAKMKRQNAAFRGGYTEKAYPLTVQGQPAGTVTLGYYGPYFYTDNDINFLNTLNRILILGTALAGLLSLLAGTYLAKRLSVPIARVINSAEEIAKGNYQDRITEKSDMREIINLEKSINTLADTLGKQEILRKRLTADVAHELRTPIANLQSHLEAMIDGIWQADRKRLISCHEETLRMAKIVNDLGNLAIYESENLILHPVSFPLADFMKGLVLNFENEFRKKNVTLSCKTEEQDLFADKDLLAQVLTNLLSNALKYTPTGGSVTISTASDADQVQITVTDTGIGISPADLPFIFERFYRADQSRSRVTGGSGIGLTIARSLVEAQHGSLSVRSEAGVGSQFTILLPRNRKEN